MVAGVPPQQHPCRPPDFDLRGPRCERPRPDPEEIGMFPEKPFVVRQYRFRENRIGNIDLTPTPDEYRAAIATEFPDCGKRISIRTERCHAHSPRRNPARRQSANRRREEAVNTPSRCCRTASEAHSGIQLRLFSAEWQEPRTCATPAPRTVIPTSSRARRHRRDQLALNLHLVPLRVATRTTARWSEAAATTKWRFFQLTAPPPAISKVGLYPPARRRQSVDNPSTTGVNELVRRHSTPSDTGGWGLLTSRLQDLCSFLPSMYRDLSAGQPTEVEHVFGDLVARADALGIAVPLLGLATVHLRVHQNRARSTGV
ncbi:hypothetical protein AMES_5487 [Amycolatopsis mediterranei S699]|uniref:Ketopantoate reductase C-terminal domain-containing protein n=1 Tax=Amycolatopsis mediterranei (strain U-32) TaxID=749927 RepID=A0A0H3D9K4_AMYMU|nr:hypothetical protein AMED_5554 [Amycolatopsis mediterranei U32]AFO79023.1 hypothetical protein AMES_5487 [Amycolatopsis mediterranei S699]AGT86151.1 hypothetical protein B737_5487 [Amycolatopsis mediterranei RB]